jgi:uncharacterized protein involved in type VI secretion and phage assembly
VNSQKEIDTFVNDEHKALISELLTITGSGDNPQVKLGSVVSIGTSMRADTGFQVQDFGKFLVTSVTHQLDGVGHYVNSFQGVSADSEKLFVRHIQKPMPDMQLATVLDNDDPQKQGRIKVQFKWQCTSNDPTEWLRILSPSAGNDDQGQNNRGFMAIPEIKDQVLVGFEEGNIARPVIMGSVYHSNNGDSAQQVNNHLKSIGTRSGHIIGFDDSPGTQGITISDRKGNVILINTYDDSMEITSLGNMTLNAKNLKIRVEENMDVLVGQNKKEVVKGDMEQQSQNLKHDVIDSVTQTTGKKFQHLSGETTLGTTQGKMILDGTGTVVIQSKDRIDYGE